HHRGAFDREVPAGRSAERIRGVLDKDLSLQQHGPCLARPVRPLNKNQAPTPREDDHMKLRLTAVSACLLAGWTVQAHANTATEWNALALGCITRPGATQSLDVALVQAAVHDAVQAIEHKYEPYLATPSATGAESKAAAAAAAAYRVLSDDR